MEKKSEKKQIQNENYKLQTFCITGTLVPEYI